MVFTSSQQGPAVVPAISAVILRESGGSSTPWPIYGIGRKSTISRRDAPELCWKLPALKTRAQGRPGARCTRGLACGLHKTKCTRAYRFSGNTPAFPAQWLYGLYRALPGERLSCHRRRRDTSRPLDASTAASGPHDFAVRFSHARLRDISVHRIPPHVRDDHEPPLLSGET